MITVYERQYDRKYFFLETIDYDKINFTCIQLNYYFKWSYYYIPISNVVP